MRQRRSQRPEVKKESTKVQDRAKIDRKKKPLSIRENSAVRHYLRFKNKYEACLHAGYSENTARTRSSTIFNREHVADFIEQAKKERARSVDITMADQIYRINNIILAFDEIQMLSMKPKLGKNQKARMYILHNMVKGTTVLDAIKLQNELLGLKVEEEDNNYTGPTFTQSDAGL